MKLTILFVIQKVRSFLLQIREKDHAACRFRKLYSSVSMV
jgi:hypothetical protein